MSSVSAFDLADKGASISYSVLLRDVRDSDRLYGILPAGSAMRLPDMYEGKPYFDSGYRGVKVYARDSQVFLAALADAGIADCIYLVEPRALRPVQLPSPALKP